MINKMVLECLKMSGKSKTWLAKELNIAWSTLNEKLIRNSFTGEELLSLSIIFNEFNIDKLIKEKKSTLLKNKDVTLEINLKENFDIEKTKELLSKIKISHELKKDENEYKEYCTVKNIKLSIVGKGSEIARLENEKDLLNNKLKYKIKDNNKER